MSYEFVRRADIPLIQLVLSRILLQGRVDDFADVVNVLVNGDDHASPANPATTSNLSTLDEYVTDMKTMIQYCHTINEVKELIKDKEEELQINFIIDDIDKLLKANKKGINKI